MPIRSVSDLDFKQNIPGEGLSVVDFSTPWCPPCKVLLPILEDLQRDYDDTVSVLKINPDDSPATASEYMVMAMPTVIIFKDGMPVEKLVGLRPKEVYQNLINKYLQ